MFRSAYIVLLLAACSVFAKSQNFPEIDSNFYTIRYGAFADIGYNLHSGSFHQLPGIPNCCIGYDGGGAFGWSAGTFGRRGITVRVPHRQNNTVNPATTHDIRP